MKGKVVKKQPLPASEKKQRPNALLKIAKLNLTGRKDEASELFEGLPEVKAFRETTETIAGYQRDLDPVHQSIKSVTSLDGITYEVGVMIEDVNPKSKLPMTPNRKIAKMTHDGGVRTVKIHLVNEAGHDTGTEQILGHKAIEYFCNPLKELNHE